MIISIGVINKYSEKILSKIIKEEDNCRKESGKRKGKGREEECDEPILNGISLPFVKEK